MDAVWTNALRGETGFTPEPPAAKARSGHPGSAFGGPAKKIPDKALARLSGMTSLGVASFFPHEPGAGRDRPGAWRAGLQVRVVRVVRGFLSDLVAAASV